MKNIIFCGNTGKMGKKIFSYLSSLKDICIKGVVNITSSPLTSFCLEDIDVVVDFTCSKACYEHALYCAKNNTCFVSGTTGLKEFQLKEIEEAFKKSQKGCFICPNFSKGIQFILKSSSLISTYFDKCSLEETHHVSKLDKPSGTSLLLKKSFPFIDKIISKRKKHYNAIHKLTFENSYEECIIIHKVKDKLAYCELVKKAIDDIFNYTGLKQNF